jgi:hypothetical protein
LVIIILFFHIFMYKELSCSWKLTNSGFDIQYYIQTCELHLFFKIDVQHVSFVKVWGHVVAGKETVKYPHSDLMFTYERTSHPIFHKIVLWSIKNDFRLVNFNTHLSYTTGFMTSRSMQRSESRTNWLTEITDKIKKHPAWGNVGLYFQLSGQRWMKSYLTVRQDAQTACFFFNTK